MAASTAMHVLRIYHRRIRMVAVFLFTSALFAVPTAFFPITAAFFAVTPRLNVAIPRLGAVTPAIPTPETPSKTVEQQ